VCVWLWAVGYGVERKEGGGRVVGRCAVPCVRRLNLLHEVRSRLKLLPSQPRQLHHGNPANCIKARATRHTTSNQPPRTHPTHHTVVNGGEVMMVPANVMSLWLNKFQHKFKRDPDFLTRQVGREDVMRGVWGACCGCLGAGQTATPTSNPPHSSPTAPLDALAPAPHPPQPHQCRRSSFDPSRFELHNPCKIGLWAEVCNSKCESKNQPVKNSPGPLVNKGW